MLNDAADLGLLTELSTQTHLLDRRFDFQLLHLLRPHAPSGPSIRRRHKHQKSTCTRGGRRDVLAAQGLALVEHGLLEIL